MMAFDIRVKSIMLFPEGYVIELLFIIWALCSLMKASNCCPHLFSFLQCQSRFWALRSPKMMKCL